MTPVLVFSVGLVALAMGVVMAVIFWRSLATVRSHKDLGIALAMGLGAAILIGLAVLAYRTLFGS
jgi:hypothetical protein